MPGISKTRSIDRIIDANINRLKEGLRVCEEITRFILNHSGLTAGFKKIRHQIEAPTKRLNIRDELIKSRKSQKDVGRDIYIGELKRKNLADIFFANIQRAKESLRVLEEFSKLKNTKCAMQFKKTRYNLYEIEKKAASSIAALCRPR